MTRVRAEARRRIFRTAVRSMMNRNPPHGRGICARRSGAAATTKKRSSEAVGSLTSSLSSSQNDRIISTTHISRKGEPHSVTIDFTSAQSCCMSLLTALEETSMKYHVLRKVLLMNADEILLENMRNENTVSRQSSDSSVSVSEVVTEDGMLQCTAPTFCVQMLQSITRIEEGLRDDSKTEIIRQTSHLVLDLSIHIIQNVNCNAHHLNCQSIASSLFDTLFMYRHVTHSSAQQQQHMKQYMPLEPRAVLRAVRIFSLHLPLYQSITNVKEEIIKYIEFLMRDSKNLTSAIGLIIHFQLEEFATQAVIDVLIDDDRDLLAEELADCWSQLAVYTVGQCREYGKLKAACRIAKNLSVANQFPNLENEYRESTVRKLVRKGQFDIAACFVIDIPELQCLLLQLLVENGCADLALEVHKSHQFSCALPEILIAMSEAGVQFQSDVAQTASDENKAAAAAAAGKSHEQEDNENWLKLDIMPIFVDSEAGVYDMIKAIDNSSVVAIDTEWKPDMLQRSEKNKNSVIHDVALLQVAVPHYVFVVDMIMLKDYHNALECLTLKVFGCTAATTSTTTAAAANDSYLSERRTVIGYNVYEDIRRLQKCLPTLLSMPSKQRANIVDVEKLAKEVGVFADKDRRSLSDLSCIVLGQPLNKVVRMTDWERRPLSAQQLTYAALDAHCLLLIVNKMEKDAGLDKFKDAWKSSYCT